MEKQDSKIRAPELAYTSQTQGRWDPPGNYPSEAWYPVHLVNPNRVTKNESGTPQV